MPPLEASVEDVERAERGDVGRLFLEDRDVGRDPFVDVLHLGLEELGDLVVDRLLLGGVGREVALLLVDTEEVGPRLRLAIERFERADRVGVLAVCFVDGAVSRERFVDLVDLVDEHATELQTKHDREVRSVRRVDRGAVRGDRAIPALRRLRGALGVRRRLLVVRSDLERGEVPLEGLRGLLDAAFVEASDLAQERELVVGVLLVRELHLDGVREELRVARRGVDRDERLGRAEVLRLELEDLLVRLRRAIGLLLLVRPELGDLEEHADLRLRVRLLRLLLLEDADELVPLAGLGVEDLEVVPATEREVLLLERLLRLAIVRVEREERAPRGDRALVVVQTIAVDRSELVEDLDLLRGVVGDLGLLLEDRRELVELLAALVEHRERGERLGVRVVARDDLVPQLDADVGLLDALGGELRHLEELRGALGTLSEAFGFAALQTEELLPVAALLVHLAQVVDRGRVLRIDRDHGLVRLHGLGLVRELADVEVGGLHVELDLFVVVGDERRELEERLDVLVEALGAFLLLCERAELGDLAFVGRGSGVRGLGLGLGSRRGRRRRFGNFHFHLGGRRRGRGRIRVLRSDVRSARRGRRRSVVRRSSCVAELLSDLRFERAELRVIGMGGREAREDVLRANQVAHLAPRDRARLREEERRVAVLAGVRHRLFGEREHAIPVAALLAVHLAQEEERAVLRRDRA